MQVTTQSIYRDLKLIREKSPLIHSITNYVVMNTTANALLALGASPIMAHAIDEMNEMVAISGALVLNIGTLDVTWIKSMHEAAKAAKTKRIPIILDPVGSGASKIRTETCREFLRQGYPTIVRGNGSEIQSLVTDLTQTKGVDSTLHSDAAIEAGKLLSKNYNCAVSISGEVDINIKDDQIIMIKNGHPIMTKVTGMGCTSTTFVAAFSAINPCSLQASAHAMAIMGIAGEIAFKTSNGPGSFQANFLDTVFNLRQKDIETYYKV